MTIREAIAAAIPNREIQFLGLYTERTRRGMIALQLRHALTGERIAIASVPGGQLIAAIAEATAALARERKRNAFEATQHGSQKLDRKGTDAALAPGSQRSRRNSSAA